MRDMAWKFIISLLLILHSPVNGSWAEWGNWSPCSSSCGGGKRLRVRSCTNPPQSLCNGTAEESESCNTHRCDAFIVDGWGEWSEWSPCSLTCGGGQRLRVRFCANPPPFVCNGTRNQSEPCNAHPCNAVRLAQGQRDITQSAEYRLRQALLSRQDRMVRPVLKASDVINVTFQVDFRALAGVDNRDQVVTTNTEITQIWTNPFLQWNAAHYEGIKQILVDPKEIWVPDIVLENNADDLVVQAGHLEKFRVFVIVRNDGVNMWVSPATFKSSCDLNVKFFPFDKQECSMHFRSLTADRSLMDIYTNKIESHHPEEDLKLTSSNGYWSLRSIAINTKDYDKQGRQFREAVVSFFIGRKPMFFVLFSLVPCMIIGMLILVSFFIPAESGERIGLCATILLAVSVYLLVVTDQLPEQSDTLPLIGVYYIVIMFEIGLALAATVLVLMAHHATSKPPKFLTYLTVLNGIACWHGIGYFRRICRGKKRKHNIGAPTSPESSVASGAENSGITPEEEDVELGDVKETAENPGITSKEVDANRVAVEKKYRPSDAATIVTVDEDEENSETWKEIARALDRIFFWVFLALFVLSTIVIYGQAGRLSGLDKLKI